MLLTGKGFSLFGLNIQYYGLIIAIAMVLAVIVVCSLCKKRGLKIDDILLLALYAIPIAIVGARAFYIIFETTGYTFLQMIAIWNGGLVLYGAIIGGVIGAGLYCLIHKKSFLIVGDVACVGLILGQGIGRIGCYFAGCCYGIKVTNENLMWFPFSTQIDGVWHLSTPFYECFFDLILFAILLIMIYKIKTQGIVLSTYFMGYGIIRFCLEFLRGDDVWTMGSLRVSQYISLIAIVVGLALLITILVLKKKKPQLFAIKEKTQETEVQKEVIAEKKKYRKCPYCGARIKEEDEKCKNCGSSLDETL